MPTAIVPAFVCLIPIAALAQPAPAPAPCSLVTRAEVQQAAGVEVSAGAPNSINKLVCEYKTATPGSIVSVLLTAKAAADSAERTVAELNKRKLAASVVPGLGDSAYAASPGYGMQQLGAYKGSKHVVVTVLLMGAPEAKAKAAAAAVMKKALERL
ncbi:MAG: hypothetical protein C0504_14125 [Candidatus Solibacter sp.]|nr:hypothetical protein [Candidatus Solibacter sp.]